MVCKENTTIYLLLALVIINLFLHNIYVCKVTAAQWIILLLSLYQSNIRLFMYSLLSMLHNNYYS